MRYITISELRKKLGGRSRNSIFRDIEDGILPPPFKLQKSRGGRNYWVEEDVDDALRDLADRAQLKGDENAA